MENEAAKSYQGYENNQGLDSGQVAEEQPSQREERIQQMQKLLREVGEIDKPLDAMALSTKIEEMLASLQKEMGESLPSLTVKRGRGYEKTENEGEVLTIDIMCNEEPIVQYDLAHKKDRNGRVPGVRDVTQKDLEQGVIYGLGRLVNRLKKEQGKPLGI